jgi:beta-N-acetylhexosaminidase
MDEIAGRVLMVGFHGTALDEPTAARIRGLRPGGVILFRRNLDTPDQTAGLVERLSGLIAGRPWVALDQEGGRVSRLEGWIGPTPTSSDFARVGAPTVERFGQATAGALGALGFNLDFAPVLDLCEPGVQNGIGDRSFGTDPGRTAELAGAFLRGLQSRGVAGCLKHFPGLGDTRVDSHVVLPSVARSQQDLERIDLLPFKRLASEAASVMVGHGHYAAWDPGEPRPASGSPAIVSGLLRERIGFDGLIVSDDLEMGAVSELDADGAFGVQAVAAGCDLILYCSDLDRAERARDALVRRADDDDTFARRLADAAARVERTAADWPAPAPQTSEWEQARANFVEFARTV